MPTRCGGWVQGFNGQLAVTDDQLILAAEVSSDADDVHQLVPMMAAAQRGAALLSAHSTASCPPDQPQTCERIGVLFPDAGYLSEVNLSAPGPDRIIAPGTRRDVVRAATPSDDDLPLDATPAQRNAHRTRTAQGRATDKRRGATVEPVIGQLKDGVGMRRFSCRGARGAHGEVQPASTVHNLLTAPQRPPAKPVRAAPAPAGAQRKAIGDPASRTKAATGSKTNMSPRKLNRLESRAIPA